MCSIYKMERVFILAKLNFSGVLLGECLKRLRSREISNSTIFQPRLSSGDCESQLPSPSQTLSTRSLYVHLYRGP